MTRANDFSVISH